MKPITIFIGALILAAIIGTYGSNPQTGGGVLVIGIIAAVILGKSKSSGTSGRQSSGGAQPVGQGSTTRASRPTAASAPKVQKPKCKHAVIRLWNRSGARYNYCACKSPGAEVRAYPAVSNEFGLPVMGCEDAPKQSGNWWTLCVNGKSDDNGKTPSRCTYYRS